MERNIFILHMEADLWIDQQTYDLAQEYVDRFAVNFANDNSVLPNYTGGDPHIYVRVNNYNKKHYVFCNAYINRFKIPGNVYKIQTFNRDLYYYANDYIGNGRNKYRYYKDLNEGIKEGHNAHIDSLDEHQANIRYYEYDTYRFLKRYVDIHFQHFCEGSICLAGVPRPPILDLEVLRLASEVDTITIDLIFAKLIVKNIETPLGMSSQIKTLEKRLYDTREAYNRAMEAKYMENRRKGGGLSRKTRIKSYNNRNSRK